MPDTTVGDLMFQFCPLLTVIADPEALEEGVFHYNAIAPSSIVVRNLDATDTRSITVALHEIAHYQRYMSGVPYYRIPHKTPEERAREEMTTDVLAISLAQEVFGQSEMLQGIVDLLTLHTENYRKELR